MILSNSPSLSDQDINFLFTTKNERKTATQTETCQKKSELICTKIKSYRYSAKVRVVVVRNVE